MRPVLLLIITALLLNACGTKGPLYIPEKEYPIDGTSKDGTNKDTRPDASKQ